MVAQKTLYTVFIVVLISTFIIEEICFVLFFKTQEGKLTVSRSIFSGNWISRLTKEEKMLKRTNF